MSKSCASIGEAVSGITAPIVDGANEAISEIGDTAGGTWLENNKQALVAELHDPINIYLAGLTSQQSTPEYLAFKERMNDPGYAAFMAADAAYTDFANALTFGIFSNQLGQIARSEWHDSGIQGTATQMWSSGLANGSAALLTFAAGGEFLSPAAEAYAAWSPTGATIVSGSATAGGLVYAGAAGNASYYAYQAGDTQGAINWGIQSALAGGLSGYGAQGTQAQIESAFAESDLRASFGGQPQVGATLYRVHGGAADEFGSYWTTVDPTVIPNYRAAAGLPWPCTNSGQSVTVGTLTNLECVRIQVPKPGPTTIPNTLMIPEIFVPTPALQIRPITTFDVDPPF